MPGYMQISSIGNSDILQGNLNALVSENAVITYSEKQYDNDLQIKKYVEENRNKFKNSPTVFVQEKSIANQIKEFKGLVDEEIITESEFEAKKKQLLGL